nr:MAG TPA: hypothetical protein [Bacteriophage sp.]
MDALKNTLLSYFLLHFPYCFDYYIIERTTHFKHNTPKQCISIANNITITVFAS